MAREGGVLGTSRQEPIGTDVRFFQSDLWVLSAKIRILQDEHDQVAPFSYLVNHVSLVDPRKKQVK